MIKSTDAFLCFMKDILQQVTEILLNIDDNINSQLNINKNMNSHFTENLALRNLPILKSQFKQPENKNHAIPSCP